MKSEPLDAKDIEKFKKVFDKLSDEDLCACIQTLDHLIQRAEHIKENQLEMFFDKHEKLFKLTGSDVLTPPYRSVKFPLLDDLVVLRKNAVSTLKGRLESIEVRITNSESLINLQDKVERQLNRILELGH